MLDLAEGVGFEPTVQQCCTPDFESDQLKKCPENQGTRHLATAMRHKAGHNFGTASADGRQHPFVSGLAVSDANQTTVDLLCHAFHVAQIGKPS